MSEVTAAVVGTGDPDDTATFGFAMGHVHGRAYDRLDDVQLVGAADVVRENVETFGAAFGLDDEQLFEDYEAMLAAVEPDVVSICTPPATHAELVMGAAASSAVDAVHCEKPMALTWGGSQRMVQECARRDVALTFNHMRRFADVVRDAKERLEEGTIGDLQRVEYTWGGFYDNGTHAIDLCNYFNDGHAAEWVIGQLDYREADVRFGTHNENHMFASWQYENGVHGVASTGPGDGLADADFRLIGKSGTLEVDVEDVSLRLRQTNGDDETVEYDEMAVGEESCHDRAIADVVDALQTGETSELCASNAIDATEIIFAGYESVRRRGRVDLPLTIDDNPLEAMVEAGDLSPAETDD